MANSKKKSTKKSANKSTGDSGRNTSAYQSREYRSASSSRQNAASSARTTNSARRSSAHSAQQEVTRRENTKQAGSSKSGIREKVAELGSDRSALIRTMTKLFIALCLLMVLIVGWRNRVEWSCANIRQCVRDSTVSTDAGSGFPVTVVGSKTVSVDELSGNIAALSDNMFLVYSGSSGEAISDSHYMSSPAMKTAGRYALVYDIGSKRYLLEATSGCLASGTTENPIIAAAVSRSGSYCLVQQGSSYSSSFVSSVEVYSLSGELLHKWHSAEWHIIGAALSSDGSCLALSGVGAKDGILQSVIILHTVGSDQELTRIIESDNIYIDLEFTVNNVLFAVGNEKLTIVKNRGKEHESVALSGELVAYDVNYNYGLALFTSDDSGADSGELTMYDARGRERYTVAVPLEGLSVSLYDSGCCILGRGELRAYHNSGELYGVWEVELGCSDVLAIGGKAYLLEGVKISQQKIRKNVDD